MNTLKYFLQWLTVWVVAAALTGCGGSATVTVEVEGAGTVISPGQLNCGNDCTARVFISDAQAFNGKIVELEVTAEPEPGYELLAWNNEQCSYGENPVCTLRLFSGCGVGLYPIPVCFVRATSEEKMQAVFVEKGTVVEVGWSPRASCGVMLNGELQCWGNLKDTTMPDLSNPSQVEVTAGFMCVEEQGAAKCWRLLDASPSFSPTLYPPFTLVAGAEFMCAQDSVGISCWTQQAEFDIPELVAPGALYARYPHVCVEDQGQRVCWNTGTVFRQ